MPQTNDALARALAMHRTASNALLERAGALPLSEWDEPIGDGKWSRATIVEHLICTYDVVLDELAGGSGMKVRTSLIPRLLLRLFVAPRIARGKGFPKNAPAPKETRPRAMNLDHATALALFREKAERLDSAARSAPPGQQVTHAYFGKAPLADGITLVARHIEHHMAQL